MSISISMPSFIKYYNVKELGQFHFIYLFIYLLLIFFFFCEFAPTDGKWFSAITWARSCLYQRVYNFYQNITHETRVWARFIFFRILTSAKPRPITIDLGLELVNINAYAFFFLLLFQNIPHRSRDRASFIFSEFRRRQSLDQWQMTFDDPLD